MIEAIQAIASWLAHSGLCGLKVTVWFPWPMLKLESLFPISGVGVTMETKEAEPLLDEEPSTS